MSTWFHEFEQEVCQMGAVLAQTWPLQDSIGNIGYSISAGFLSDSRSAHRSSQSHVDSTTLETYQARVDELVDSA